MSRLNKVWIKPAATAMGLALFFALATTGLRAQEANPDARAARLSYVQGNVQITQGNQILASPAPVNTPLFEGTVISTKENGQAEIQFDDGTIARISPNSSLEITVLRQQDGLANDEVEVRSGLAYLELQGNSSKGQATAHFDDSSVTASGFTVLRIDMDNPPGELSVFSGNAHLERGNALSLDLRGGESVTLNSSDPNQYNLAETIEPNSWDAWNADRDQELTTQQSAKTAASEAQPNSSNPAWGDLDANGNWYNVPGQGYVWSPNEAASSNWQPYGCGSWVWSPQYGYVWASCDSWGYLPYNSGSWDYYDGFGWGWAPGFGYPWWNTGIFVINVGRPPFRFQPPHRPHGGPVHPPGIPTKHPGLIQSNPVIAVNRIPKSVAPTANPVHVVGGPATIAGNTVEPLRPLSPRPVYNHTTLSGSNYPGVGYSVFPNNEIRNNASAGYTNRPGYSSPTGSLGYRPDGNHMNNWGMQPLAPGSTYRPPVAYPGGVTRYSGAPGAPPVPHVPVGGGAHVGPAGGGASAPHVSAGGGGGGGVHASPSPASGGHH